MYNNNQRKYSQPLFKSPAILLSGNYGFDEIRNYSIVFLI